MASASIQFSQNSTVGAAGKSVLGLAPDANVVMTDLGGPSVTTYWEFLSWPSPQANPPAILDSNSQVATAQGPFVDGIYIVKLTRIDETGTTRDVRFFGVADADGLSLPSAGMTPEMCDLGDSEATASGWAGGQRGDSNYLLDAYLRKRREREGRYAGDVAYFHHTAAGIVTLDLEYGVDATIQVVDISSSHPFDYNILPVNIQKGATFTFVFRAEADAPSVTISFDGGLLWLRPTAGLFGQVTTTEVTCTYLGDESSPLIANGWLVQQGTSRAYNGDLLIQPSFSTFPTSTAVTIRGGEGAGLVGPVNLNGFNINLDGLLVYPPQTTQVLASTSVPIEISNTAGGPNASPKPFLQVNPLLSMTLGATPTIKTTMKATAFTTVPVVVGTCIRLQNIGEAVTLQKDAALGGPLVGSKLSLPFNNVTIATREIVEFMYDGNYWVQMNLSPQTTPVQMFAYSTAGTYTWAKPANATFVRIIAVGSGGGGASGQCGDSTAFRYGGGGGSGGGITDTTLLASNLPSTGSVAVSGGGNGGSGVTGPISAAGSNGAASSVTFGVTLTNRVIAYGGTGASATPTATVGGGDALYKGASNIAVSGSVVTSGFTYVPSLSNAGAGAGGNGGSIDAATTLGYGTGGSQGAPFMGGGNSGAGGSQASPNGSAGTAATFTGNPLYPAGGGAGGGAGRYTANGGAGGIGGLGGGGGGGGGAARNGYTSGAGGKGGGGLVVIYTW